MRGFYASELRTKRDINEKEYNQNSFERRKTDFLIVYR